MFTLPGPVTHYSLPEDGVAAELAFLSILHNPNPTYLQEYGFTWQALFAEIKQADANGVCVEMLLDKTQFCGPTEHARVLDLVACLQHSCVTITTSGPEARHSSGIAHRKSIMDAISGLACIGSVNASESGFLDQDNDLFVFQSLSFVTAAVTKFTLRKAWARQHLAPFQVM